MAVTVELPPDVEQRLRAASPNLDAEAKEAMLIGLYRQDKISHRELSQALGLTRFETDGLLKKHNVTEDLPTNNELDAAFAHLRAVMGT